MVWNEKIKDLANQLNANVITGLSEEVAAELLLENGHNQLPISKKKPIWKIVLQHFLEPFVLVLIALAIIAVAIGQWREEATVVFLIVIVDVTLSTYQEVKAASSLDALKN